MTINNGFKKTNTLAVEDGAILIGPSVISQMRATRQKRADAAEALPQTADGLGIIGPRKAMNDSFIDTWTPKDESVFDVERGSKKKGKKHKKNKKNKGKKKQSKYYRDLKLKKKKGKHEKKLQDLKENCVDARKPNLPAVLSELLSSSELIAVYMNKVYIYSDTEHCFVKCDAPKAQIMLMDLLSSSERLCVMPRDVKNAYDTLLVLPELQRDLSPTINIPLINCSNGVLSLESMALLKHDPRYAFTHCIQANYDEKAQGKVFKKWLDEATMGDKEIKNLLQEIIGYALSEYVFAKKAFMLYGVKDSGKSVLLNLIGRMVGEEYVSHVALQRLSEPCFAARLKDSKLNIDPDVSDAQMKEIGFFKSVTSSTDFIETKALYENPTAQACYCKLLFGANSYIPLGKLDSKNVDAFFRRILIVPFMYSKPEKEQDLYLADKLWEERDYIFTWAMQGAKRLLSNNFEFTRSKVSEEKLNEYKAKYSPEKCFFEKYLTLQEDSVISADKVQRMYEDYAEDIGVKTIQNAMKEFLRNTYPQVIHKRKHINKSKNALAAYIGLAFKS